MADAERAVRSERARPLTLPVLAYGGADAKTSASARLAVDRVAITCMVLTLIAVSTCVLVEVLNAQAGGVLPVKGKWRVGPGRGEQSWREIEAFRGGDATLTTRPLTPTEHVRMTRVTRRVRANDNLRGLVTTFGCAQYVIVPVVLVLSLRLVRKSVPPHHRLAGAACLVAGLTAGVFMLWRGYFTSVVD